jgi:hypothetical protein
VKDRLPALSPAANDRLITMKEAGEIGRPGRTVRDAIKGLPTPTLRNSSKHLNHVLQPGARSYAGHTGSYIDLPAKTLKAGAHGVPGGRKHATQS